MDRMQESLNWSERREDGTVWGNIFKISNNDMQQYIRVVRIRGRQQNRRLLDYDMLVMQLSCYLLILQFLLLYYFVISDKQIGIDPVQIREPPARNRTIPFLRSLEKWNRVSSFGNTTFQIRTRSILVMYVVHFDLSKLFSHEPERLKPSAITNICMINVLYLRDVNLNSK